MIPVSGSVSNNRNVHFDRQSSVSISTRDCAAPANTRNEEALESPAFAPLESMPRNVLCGNGHIRAGNQQACNH